MICVAWGPAAYGCGSWPLNSDWMKCNCQLRRGKKKKQPISWKWVEICVWRNCGFWLVWQEEAAGESVPLFAYTHTDGPAFGDRVKARILGNAMEFWVKVQRGVVAYRWKEDGCVLKGGVQTTDWSKKCVPVHTPLKRATERESDSTVKTTTVLRANQFEDTV